MAYRILKFSLVLIATVVLIATAPREVDGDGKYAGEFLNVDICADNAATGGAFSAILNNAGVMFYNPAGLSNVGHTSASFMRMEDIVGKVGTDLGMNSNFIGVSSKVGSFMFGINYFATTVDGIMDTRNLTFEDINHNGVREDGERVFYDKDLISMGTDREVVAIVGCSHNVTDSLTVGINAKNISQSVFEFSSGGVGIDAGIFYKRGYDNNLKLGICIQDIGDTGILWTLRFYSSAQENSRPYLQEHNLLPYSCQISIPLPSSKESMLTPWMVLLSALCHLLSPMYWQSLFQHHRQDLIHI